MSGQLIELGLKNFSVAANRSDRHTSLLWLVEHLFGLMAGLPINNVRSRTEEFREKQKEYLKRLESSSSGDSSAVAEECFQFCQTYVQRASEHMLRRESDFNHAFHALRQDVAELVVESKGFQNRLNESSERFERLTDIRELRELNERLAHEVLYLKQTLAEKQEQEDKSQRRMVEQIQDLEHRLVEAKVEAALDALTCVANRRSLDDELKRRIAYSKVKGRSFACALIDVDNFKTINDTYGHPVGDVVLKFLGRFLQSSVREHDFVARYGGEEFCILFENIKLQQAEQRLTFLLHNLAASAIHFNLGEQSLSLSVTASCGLAECGPREQPWELILRTDGALYEAKKRGKNRVVASL